MNHEMQRILSLLKSTYNGDPWHGPSLTSVLNSITAEQAYNRPFTHCHTIWELVLHITAWRTFTYNKLSGNSSFDITTPQQDWPPIEYSDTNAWQATLQNLEQSQRNLIHAIENSNDTKLKEVVPGRTYPFYVLLHGIIQHDLYHAGQITLLKKQA